MKHLLLTIIVIALSSCGSLLNNPEVKADIQNTEQDVIKDAEQILNDATKPNPAPVSPQ